MLLIDTRSHRLTSDGVLLGQQQMAWLLDELLAARDSHALTVLVGPTAWIGAAEQGADHWGGYAAERRQIGEFLAEQAIDNVVLVGGDAHGRHRRWHEQRVRGDSGFPVLQVAALDRPGSVKGGPYSKGVFPGGGHFGVVEVTDTGGDSIDVELIGLDWEGDVLTSLHTTFSVP